MSLICELARNIHGTFPLEAISMSFVLAWLVNRSGSVWPSALAHGANNALLSFFLIVPAGWIADQWTAVAVVIPIGALFAWLLHKRRPTPA
jgi:membrane protease YdiL (CAAX protease family)